MALNFAPPDWVVQEYMNRKTPYQEASIGLQTALQNYLAIDEAKRRNTTQQREWDQREALMGMKGRESFYEYGDPSGLAPQEQSAISSPVQGPPTEQGMQPQLSPVLQYFQEFSRQYPQGIAGAGMEARQQVSPQVGGTRSPGFNKPPTGFRWLPNGELEPIPGGPSDIKLGEKTKKEEGLKQAGINQADIVIGKVDQALKNVSGWSTGWGAKLLGGVPGPAKNLRKDIDTIKANLGFAQLQEMRRNSPTGGALGQIAVQELDMLQSTVSSLDPEQTDDQLKRNLGEVKNHFENWKNAVSGNMSSNQNTSSNETVRQTKDGRKAVFDSTTKQFIRWAK